MGIDSVMVANRWARTGGGLLDILDIPEPSQKHLFVLLVWEADPTEELRIAGKWSREAPSWR